MRYGKGFKTSLTTVILVIGLGFIFSILSKGPSLSSTVVVPDFSDRQLTLMKRYLECKPYVGYRNLYEVWHKEAEDAIQFGETVAPVYRAKNLARSLDITLKTSKNDPDLIKLATILVLRDDLIRWYANHLDKSSFILFQQAHVGYLRLSQDNKCVDYSFLPVSVLPYELKGIDIKNTWKEANKRGLAVAGYVDGIYIEKVLFDKYP